MSDNPIFQVQAFQDRGDQVLPGEIVLANDAADATVKALQAMARFGGAAVLRLSPSAGSVNIHSTYGAIPDGFAASTLDGS